MLKPNANIKYCRFRLDFDSSPQGKCTDYECEVHYETPLSHMSLFPLSRNSLRLLAFYLAILFAVLLYDLLYFYLVAPSQLSLTVNTDRPHTFLYTKSIPLLTIYLPPLLEVAKIIFVSSVQWLSIKAVSNTVRYSPLRKALVATIYYAMCLLSMYLMWGYAKVHYSLEFLPVLIEALLPIGPDLTSADLIRSADTSPIKGSVSFALRIKEIIQAGVPLTKYLLDTGKAPENYLNLFKKLNFDINNAYVFGSNAFGYAIIAKYPTHSKVFICENLLREENFNIFNAVFHHEMGHHVLGHGDSMFYTRMAFAGGLMLFLLVRIFCGPKLTLRRVLNLLFAALIAVYLFRMGCNLHSQSLEYEADRFACEKAPEATKHLIFALLQDLKTDRWVVEHTISPHNFVYPPFHPLYTHPSKLNRILELNKCNN